MKNLSNFILISFLLFVSSSEAQTNVSGGIYTNTTWTLANSPYIVVDTVVVFPGVTLFIEPGVTVKFETGVRLEIRQGRIAAFGTVSDSITFTSNSAAPFPGIWNEIWNNRGVASEFAYCNFHYANNGIRNQSTPLNAMTVSNSNFSYNLMGVTSNSNGSGFNSILNCGFTNNTTAINGCNYILDNCNIRDNETGIFLYPSSGTYNYISNSVINMNQTGISGDAAAGAAFYSLKNSSVDSNSIAGLIEGDYPAYTDTILHCEFNGNNIALLDSFGGGIKITESLFENNSIGLKINNTIHKTISCNKICNNSLWNVYFNVAFGSNMDMSNNYWCTTDSAIITSTIYDGYDNINLGLVDFTPVDMAQCYLTGCQIGVSASVTNATCDTCHNGTATAIVTNGFSPYTYTWYSTPIQTTQTATGLSSGTYTVCVTDGNGCTACNNSIFVDSTNCNGFSMYTNETNATCSACSDGNAWVTVSGGSAPFYYSWYTVPVQTTDTAINLMPGTYAVCVTDVYGCTVCDSVTIGTGSCSAHFNLYPDSIAHHYYAVNMANGVAPISYDWSWGDSTAHDTTPYPDHTYALAGFYTICLTITDSAGCTNTYCVNFYLQHNNDAMIYVNVIPAVFTGTGKLQESNPFYIYPNPAHSTFTIKNNSSSSVLQIMNPLGEIVYSEKLSGKVEELVNPHLLPGFYIVQVYDLDVKTTMKLIIN